MKDRTLWKTVGLAFVLFLILMVAPWPARSEPTVDIGATYDLTMAFAAAGDEGQEIFSDIIGSGTRDGCLYMLAALTATNASEVVQPLTTYKDGTVYVTFLDKDGDAVALACSPQEDNT